MPLPHPQPSRQRPLRQQLQASLRQARNIAVVGVGSDLRGDDIAGILVIRALDAARSINPNIGIFDGGTAPENLTGEITRFRPSHVLLVDAADLGQKPGAIRLIEPDKIEGITFSTHVLPLKILADYLKQACSCEIVVIGIQPGNTDFGKPPSRPIRAAARQVAREILAAMPGSDK